MVFGTDEITGQHFFSDYQARMIKIQHQFPFWNPYIYFGLPFIDAFHGDIFYLSAFLRLLLPTHLVVSYFYILHIFLAGLFMFLLLTYFKVNRWGSLLFSVSYMFIGSLVSLAYGGHSSKIAVAAFLPLMVLLLLKGMRETRLLWFLFLALIMGIGVLSLHIQMMYYAYILLFFIFIAEIIYYYRERRLKSLLFKLSTYFLLMVLLSLAFGSLQFIPSYYHVSNFTLRGGEGRGYQFSTSWALPPEDFVSAFVPKLSGRSRLSDPSDVDTYWGRNPFKINSEYVGILSLIFAVLALSFWRRSRYIKVFFFIFLLFSLFSLGGYTPVYYLFYHLLPGLKKFRASAMSFSYVAFSVTILGGLGFKSLMESGGGEKVYRRFVLFCGIFLGLGILTILLKSPLISLLGGILGNPQKVSILRSNFSQIPIGFFRVFLTSALFLFLSYLLLQKKVRNPLFTLLAGSLLLWDLWSIHWSFLQTLPRPEVYYAKDEVVRFLEKDKGLHRVFPLYYKTDNNYLMLYDIQSIGGHHPNPFKRYQEYIGAPNTVMFRPNNVSNLLRNPKMLDLLNVKYIITQPIPEDLTRYPPSTRTFLQEIRNFLESPGLKLVKGSGQFFIYENTDFLPRVFLVPDVRVLPEEEILQAIQTEEFNPREVAFLEEEPEVNLTRETPLTGTVEIVEWTPNRVVVEAEANEPSLLVFSENYYPYFKAEVDGEEAKVYRTNYILRGVFVPQGRHTITFYFDTSLVRLGGSFTLLSFLLICTGIIGDQIHRRRIRT